MNNKEQECPRCFKKALLHAVSRRDNKTLICTDCGNEEAFIDAGYVTCEFALNVEKTFINSLSRKD